MFENNCFSIVYFLRIRCLYSGLRRLGPNRRRVKPEAIGWSILAIALAAVFLVAAVSRLSLIIGPARNLCQVDHAFVFCDHIQLQLEITGFPRAFDTRVQQCGSDPQAPVPLIYADAELGAMADSASYSGISW